MDLFTTDTENDTPPLILKPLSYANGAHKHRSCPYPAPPIYRECLRNHAASIGGHALDGCGEFMPSTQVLKCAACGCHRNFHRRAERQLISSESSLSPPCYPTSIVYPSLQPKMLLALSSAAEKEQINFTHVPTPETPKGENRNSRERKRFRTKFTKEQKKEMLSFSDNLGWKMARADDVAVEAFCAKIGVAKGVLKVWMHNNKNKFVEKGANFAINGLSLSDNGAASYGVKPNALSNQQNGSNNGSSSSA